MAATERFHAHSLRIAILHPCYWPEVTRGSERFIHDLGTRLAARGHRPRLITSHPGPTSESTEEGLEVLRLKRPRGRRLQLGLRDVYLSHAPRLIRALREMDPDVVHAVYPVDAVAAAMWSRRAGRPLVFSLMGMPRPEALRRPIWRRLIARAIARADASTCLSRPAAELTNRAFGMTPRVIHPGVDLELFRPVASRAPVPTILCPADLNDARKRAPLVRAAFASLRASRADARLVLDRRSRRSAPADEEPGVTYADLDTPGSMVRAYSEAWATILLSDAEAFGLVLTESLACGTPVIASRGGGADDIVGDDRHVGSLVDNDDPETVARAIATSMNGEEAIRPTCIRRAAEFSVDRTATAYEQLYQSLVGRVPRP